MKLNTLLILSVLTATCARAVVPTPGTLSATWSGSQTIPDNNASGLTFQFSLNAPEPVSITNVTVNLILTGGWDGDLYAYLSHGSGFSVLLNRIGSSSSNPGGSGASGMSVEFSDSYLTDIHTGTGGSVMGNFAPDGRFVNPYTALDTDPRNAMLGNFNYLDPNGSWTLFLADVSPLAVSTVQGWTVTVETAAIQAVPEPGSAALLAAALAIGIFQRWRSAASRRRNGIKSAAAPRCWSPYLW